MNEAGTISELLSQFRAFSSLDQAKLDNLSSRVKLFYAEPGQDLLVADRLPEYVFAIISGTGRLLHSDPSLTRPVTIAMTKPGDLVGWAGIIRNFPCEWFASSTPMQLLAIPTDVFLELLDENPAVKSAIYQSSSPSEILHALRPTLDALPSRSLNDRQVLRQILPSIQIIHDSTESIQLDPAFCWIWNCQPSDISLQIGSKLTQSVLTKLPSTETVRLLGLTQSTWDSLLSFQPSTVPQSVTPTLPTPEFKNCYSSLVPPPSGSIVNNTPHTSDNSADSTSNKYPVFTGHGELQQVTACLRMLSSYHQVPYRSDIIDRAAHHQLAGRQPSLQLIGNLSTILGFTGQITPTKRELIYRLPTPFICLVQEQPTLVYSISRDSAKSVIPEYGRVTLSITELCNGEAGINALTLTPGREAHRSKLSLSWFLPQIQKYRRSLIEVFIASLVLQLLNLATPLVFQQIFDKVIGQQNLDTLYTLGFVLLAISLFQGLLGAVRTYLFSDTTNRIDINLGSEVIQHLLRLPLSYFDRRPVGELQTRLAELGNIRNFLTGSFITLVLDSIFSLIYIAVMLTYSGVLTAVSLGVVPLFLGLTIVASPIIRGQLRRTAERNAATQALLVESLSGVQTIKAQNAEETIRWRWQQRYSSFMSESFRSLLISISSGTISNFLNQLTGLLTLWVGAYLVIQGDLTIGQLIAFRIISGYVVGPLLNLATSWQSFQAVALSIERLSDVVDAKDEGYSASSDQLPLPPVQGNITYKDVSFSFNEGATPVVRSVSFDIQAGSFVGIVGRSGSGKSTIMKLLPRLYSPDTGRILIDGFDISKVQLASVRQQIGIVPQDSLLFDGTIRENICLTCPDATSDELVNAARIAAAHEFIMDLPEGYSTRVGERGSSLSGGQRQRIAIARAVLQNPSLLILDEATSALDYITERQVCLNLKEYFKAKTVFLITHRLSTISTADEILLMDSGSLVEQGTHHQLLSQKGRYYALYSQQDPINES